MSDYNEKQLKNAYRHPFEYINPRLYQRTDRNETFDKKLLDMVENEDDYNELVRENTRSLIGGKPNQSLTRDLRGNNSKSAALASKQENMDAFLLEA